MAKIRRKRQPSLLYVQVAGKVRPDLLEEEMTALVPYKKKNRKAQAVVAVGTGVAVAALTTATIISWPVAAAAALAWWVTGKITQE
jgi:hypothetical protein